jgi:hypothetical protein
LAGPDIVGAGFVPKIFIYISCNYLICPSLNCTVHITYNKKYPANSRYLAISLLIYSDVPVMQLSISGKAMSAVPDLVSILILYFQLIIMIVKEGNAAPCTSWRQHIHCWLQPRHLNGYKPKLNVFFMNSTPTCPVPQRAEYYWQLYLPGKHNLCFFRYTGTGCHRRQATTRQTQQQVSPIAIPRHTLWIAG